MKQIIVLAVALSLAACATDPGTREQEKQGAAVFAGADGERGVVRWRYQWVDADGAAGHVRGVDIFRFRDGKITEKLSYVKG